MSTLSNFSIVEPFSALKIENPNLCADIIDTFSRRLGIMFLLKLFPLGRETFRQTLTLLGCGTAKIEFAVKFATGGDLNGPQTFLLSGHVAIASLPSR